MSQKLVTIAQYRDLPQAGLDKSILESQGITCFLDNEFMIGVNWLYSTALGGVKLKVLEGDAARAKAIIQQDFGAVPATISTETELPPQDTCPRCGATEIATRNYTRKFAAVSLLLSLPLFFFLRRYRCKSCNHKWK